MYKANYPDKPTRVRFRILAFVFINVVINYMDRTNIAVAAPALSSELNLNTVQLGLIFSAFGWTYVASQIPGGILIDRFGPRVLYTITLISWSVVTLFQGFIKGFAALFGLRLAIGVFEAPSYPINNRIVTGWFPDHERASAIGFYTSGQFIGLAFLTPLLAIVQQYLGWRGLFIITGSVGIIWGMIWYFVYRDSSQHPDANQAELDYIADGTAKVSAAKPDLTWASFKQVFTSRKLWGVYIGQFAVTSTLWFFLTWFPTYLVKYRGLNFLKSGFLTSIPFLAAFAGVLLAGFFSDYLIKKGYSFGIARKTPIIAGLLLSTAIVGANYVDSTPLIILCMSVAFFGNGLASITWVFVSALAPQNLIGVTGGVFNFIGGLSSIVVPLIIGLLAKGGDFQSALLFIGSVAFLGALSYIFIVGKVSPVKSALVS
ncbi:MFS transporter [Mucilaginibacter sabulilitoris]|uniref:MFS transporter n=1 Tax=Mucilaginibacter sabulilitoris TaxID=1173583 RepID=A0ABZ0TU21_9SPHI|nr:MFS transporter [Mucilaginibacter sabulilitoris]WPU96372.1 MFS transporter [Mucilaginibacter sabulilitoris]